MAEKKKNRLALVLGPISPQQRSLIEGRGFQVEVAPNLRQAWRKARAVPGSLVLREILVDALGNAGDLLQELNGDGLQPDFSPWMEIDPETTNPVFVNDVYPIELVIPPNVQTKDLALAWASIVPQSGGTTSHLLMNRTGEQHQDLWYLADGAWPLAFDLALTAQNTQVDAASLPAAVAFDHAEFGVSAAPLSATAHRRYQISSKDGNFAWLYVYLGRGGKTMATQWWARPDALQSNLLALASGDVWTFTNTLLVRRPTTWPSLLAPVVS